MRFPQIGEKILLNLDDESLQNCRRVNLTWKHFIEDPTQKQICIRIIKQYEKCTHIQKYISIYGNWNELKSGELGKLVKEIKETKNTPRTIYERKKKNLSLDNVCHLVRFRTND